MQKQKNLTSRENKRARNKAINYLRCKRVFRKRSPKALVNLSLKIQSKYLYLLNQHEKISIAESKSTLLDYASISH